MKRPALSAIVLFWASVAAAQNLLTNGDFEAGPAGWTTWRATWGTGEVYDFNSTQPGLSGSKCLQISTTATASFGVYQEVSVTPGRVYRIDGRWKGTRFGPSQWYEILLIDGPFSQAQADNGGEPVVHANYMYAYDVTTYPITADFGWIPAHDQNGVAGLDYNSRYGLRMATGNTMTVVLKGGASSTTSGVSAWFDDVSLVEFQPGNGAIANGDFSNGSTGWTPWKSRDNNNDFSALATAGELAVSGSDINGGVYQQIDTGGPGAVVNVIGHWRSSPTLANAMYAEVLVINADRVPVDGVDETDGVNNAVLLYRNDTFGGRGAWDGPLAKTAPVKEQVSFVATGAKATLILKAGNNGPSTPDRRRLRRYRGPLRPPAGHHRGPPARFCRSAATPSRSPRWCPWPRARPAVTSTRISNSSTASNTKLYRIDVGGPSLTTTPISGLGSLVDYGQGMTFDPAGNMYISTQFGKIIKGVDTNPDPAVDAFSFSLILDHARSADRHLPRRRRRGGRARQPALHQLRLRNPLRPRARPSLTTPASCGAAWMAANLEVFAAGIRNSFDITFRADGKLFGVENGPNGRLRLRRGVQPARVRAALRLPLQVRQRPERQRLVHHLHQRSGQDRPAAAAARPEPPSGLGQLRARRQARTRRSRLRRWRRVLHLPPALLAGRPGLLRAARSWTRTPSSSPRSFTEGRSWPASATSRTIPKVGYDVLSLRLDEPNQGLIVNAFLTGMGRSIDVLCAYNGCLYVLEYSQQTVFDPSFGPTWTTAGRLHEIRYTVAAGPQIFPSVTAITRPADLGHDAANSTFTIANSGIDTLTYSIGVDQTWLSVSPAGGSSTGPSDAATITVSYATASLPIGTYTAAITITDPAALNSPFIIPVTLQVRSVRPDFDGDSDVDQTDFGHLQAAWVLPGRTSRPGCANADLDHDGYVDQGDLPVFKACKTAEGSPANPACDDPWP